MNLKIKLSIMLFLQFFLWGAWLITFGAYGINTLHMTGMEVGAIYGLMGISSIFMPGVIGAIADNWISAEKLYGICHLIGGVMLFLVATSTNPSMIYWCMLINCLVYMPTIALSNTVSYIILENQGLSVIKVFPPIRVWGTIGFIVAMWTVSLLHLELTAIQLYISSIAALVLGIYAFTLPKCPPVKKGQGISGSAFVGIIVMAIFAIPLVYFSRNMIGIIATVVVFFIVAIYIGKMSWETKAKYGLEGFELFAHTKTLIFLLFAMLLGCALQITNTFGDPFLHDFASNPAYAGSFGVDYPAIVLSLSQMSETLFILTIPFFLRKYGIKTVMLMSMFAWVFRFGFFGLGTPVMPGILLILLSNIVYGCAFDFFNIAGSLFTETESSPQSRGAAQGMFMNLTNGFGGFMGSVGAGMVVDHFSVINAAGNAIRNWTDIWFSFSAYALVIGIVFAFVFKYKHDPNQMTSIHH